MKPIAHYLEKKGLSVDDLVTTSGLDARVVHAIVSGNYTASPEQRQRLATALGVATEDVSWDHSVEVQYLRGNGPQCGRST